MGSLEHKEAMLARSKRIAVDVLALSADATPLRVHESLVRQFVRSGTSIGANYRAACRARSDAEFIAKLGIVEEEADESLYWLELLREVNAITPIQERDLAAQIDEFLRMTISAIRTVKDRRTKVREVVSEYVIDSPTVQVKI